MLAGAEPAKLAATSMRYRSAQAAHAAAIAACGLATKLAERARGPAQLVVLSRMAGCTSSQGVQRRALRGVPEFSSSSDLFSPNRQLFRTRELLSRTYRP